MDFTIQPVSVRRAEVVIKNFGGLPYIVKRQIPVLIQPYLEHLEGSQFIATSPDIEIAALGIAALGCNETEVFERLKQSLLDSYVASLAVPVTDAGPTQRHRFEVLSKFID